METTPGFTPVRRRNRPQYGESPASSVHAPWTTARCNRLLRPIASRIALLRKNSYQNINNGVSIVRGNQSRQAQNVNGYGQQSDSILVNKQEVGQRVGAASYRHDPDWLPSPILQKKLKHTYSGRCVGQTAKPNGAKRQCIDLALSDGDALGLLTHGEYDYTQETPAFHQNEDEGQKSGGQACRQIEGSSIEGQRKPCRSSRNRNHVTDTRESFSKLAKRVSPSHWMLVNGLYDGLHALLKATLRSKQANTKGPRSLLATCLRRVPKYVAAEQEWYDQEDLDDDLDMSSVIYSDLEAFGSSGVPGWKPLREVVRSHGVTLLGEAIREGLVKQDIARGLILLCLQSSAFDEAQYLVECTIAVAGQLRKPSSRNAKLFDVEASNSLSTLDLFARRTGRDRVQFRHLATLLDSGCLPIEWTWTTDFVTCWKRVIYSISREDDHAGDATHLLQTAISLFYSGTKATASSRIHDLRTDLPLSRNGLDFECKEVVRSSWPIAGSQLGGSGDHVSAPFHSQNPLNASFQGLLIFLCSTIIQPLPAMSSLSKEHCSGSTSALRYLAIDAQQALELSRLESTSSQPTFSAERATLLLLADALVGSPPGICDRNIVHAKLAEINVVATIDSKSAGEDIYTPFLCAVVQGCERGSPGGAFERLRALVQELVKVSTCRDIEAATRKLCGRVAVNTALEFSEGTNQPRHLEWALDVEDSVASYHANLTSRTPAKTPALGANGLASGYRWEEGLCEWIVKTPALLVRSSVFVDEMCEDSSSESDSAQGTPACISGISPSGPHATSTRRASGEAGYDYSHCGQNRAPCGADGFFSGHARRGPRCGTVSKIGAPILRKRIFKEVYIDDDEEDELSAHESSQEHLKRGRRSLHEISNVGVAKMRKGAATKLSKDKSEIPKHTASRPRLAMMKDGDESDDELGI